MLERMEHAKDPNNLIPLEDLEYYLEELDKMEKEDEQRKSSNPIEPISKLNQ